MNHFIRTIRSSFYDPAFYDEARKHSLGTGAKVLAKLALIGFSIWMLFALPGFVSFATSGMPQALKDAYPNNLIIAIESGKLTINQPQPYYIKNNLPVFSGKGAPKYLAIFDGTDQLLPNLDKNSTFMLVKDTYVILPDNNNQLKMMPFPQTGTTTIYKSDVNRMVERIEPYFVPGVIGGGILGLLLFVLFGTLFWLAFHMVYLLIPAFLVFLFALMRKMAVAFKEAYMISLYASIPVAIIVYVVFQMALKAPLPPFIYTLAVLLAVGINMAGMKLSRKA